MAANQNPIYSRVPRVQWANSVILNVNATKFGNGIVNTVFSAGNEGSWIDRIRITPIGTNVVTVMRIWLNNGANNNNIYNNSLLTEVSLLPTTASETSAQPPTEVPLGLGVNSAYQIFVTLGTAVANGFHVIGIGGDYYKTKKEE